MYNSSTHSFLNTIHCGVGSNLGLLGLLHWKADSSSLKPLGNPCGMGCCCSVIKLRPTLCDPMDCSTPGFPVLQYLPECSQTDVHCVDDAIQLSHPLSAPSLPAFNLSQASGSFLISRLFASGGQSIGASASVLSINIQD